MLSGLRCNRIGAFTSVFKRSASAKKRGLDLSCQRDLPQARQGAICYLGLHDFISLCFISPHSLDDTLSLLRYVNTCFQVWFCSVTHPISWSQRCLSLSVRRFFHLAKTLFPSACVSGPRIASHSVMPNSSRPHGLQPTRLLCPWDSPGKNTGVSCHSLLQGTFPTQGSNLGLRQCKQILYHLNHQGRSIWPMEPSSEKANKLSDAQSDSKWWQPPVQRFAEELPTQKWGFVCIYCENWTIKKNSAQKNWCFFKKYILFYLFGCARS